MSDAIELTKFPVSVNGIDYARMFREAPLYALLRQLHPKKMRNDKPPTKAQLAKLKRTVATQRKRDAADVLSGKKIAITQEEYDELTSQMGD